jgi:hypothetical protein
MRDTPLRTHNGRYPIKHLPARSISKITTEVEPEGAPQMTGLVRCPPRQQARREAGLSSPRGRPSFLD